jgi:hypothetical protein
MLSTQVMFSVHTLTLHLFYTPSTTSSLKVYTPKGIRPKFFSHGVKPSPFHTAATVWPILPAPDDDDDCGAIGGMRIGRGN